MSDFSEDVEKEIQARIEFKLGELLTGVKNRVHFKHMQAFDMTRESGYAWKAFEELSGMLKKEIEMPTPYDNMVGERKRKAKNIAVDNIMDALDFRDKHKYYSKVNIIVKEIEKAQNY